jgi:DNA uptake protein ComE-like DNA-binding protein
MHIREFFHIRKGDRTAILVLLVVAAVVFFLFNVLGSYDTTPFDEADSLDVARLYEEKSRYGDSEKRYRNNDFESSSSSSVELFPFDPNTATPEELLRLGLKSWQVKNMMKYRSKGGVYRTSADFAKLYGLTVEKFKQLEPYLRFTGDHRPASELFTSEKSSVSADENRRERDTLRYPVKLHEGERLTLDQMDTTSLMRVPGIGSFFARRIVEYSQRLGGFVRVEQLLEVDGVPEDALDYFTEGSGNVRRLNLNTLTLDQLKRHPYINFYQARAIVDRRRLHGALKNLDDLRLLPEFSDEAISRLKPYVEF